MPPHAHSIASLVRTNDHVMLATTEYDTIYPLGRTGWRASLYCAASGATAGSASRWEQAQIPSDPKLFEVMRRVPVDEDTPVVASEWSKGWVFWS